MHGIARSQSAAMHEACRRVQIQHGCGSAEGVTESALTTIRHELGGGGMLAAPRLCRGREERRGVRGSAMLTQ